MAHQRDTNVEIMSECHDICLKTLSHCLQQGGRYAQADHITLLLGCAEICQTSADFMLRNSDLHARTCEVCAEVCERCAEDCESLAGDDQIIRDCAEICRRCAKACRQMAGNIGRPQHMAIT
jgi:hypothetical protein